RSSPRHHRPAPPRHSHCSTRLAWHLPWSTTSTTRMRDIEADWQTLLLLWQTDVMADLDDALDAVGPRLRTLRQQRETTLADLAAATGISVSTLSRQESRTRRPTLELLLPLAKAHDVTL